MSYNNTVRSRPPSFVSFIRSEVPDALYSERTAAAGNSQAASEKLFECSRAKIVPEDLTYFDNTCGYYRYGLRRVSTGVDPIHFAEAFKDMKRYLNSVTCMVKPDNRTQEFNEEERALYDQVSKCNDELSECNLRIWCASLGRPMTAEGLSEVRHKSLKVQNCWAGVLRVHGQYSGFCLTDFARKHSLSGLNTQ